MSIVLYMTAVEVFWPETSAWHGTEAQSENPTHTWYPRTRPVCGPLLNTGVPVMTCQHGNSPNHRPIVIYLHKCTFLYLLKITACLNCYWYQLRLLSAVYSIYLLFSIDNAVLLIILCTVSYMQQCDILLVFVVLNWIRNISMHIKNCWSAAETIWNQKLFPNESRCFIAGVCKEGLCYAWYTGLDIKSFVSSCDNTASSGQWLHGCKEKCDCVCMRRLSTKSTAVYQW